MSQFLIEAVKNNDIYKVYSLLNGSDQPFNPGNQVLKININWVDSKTGNTALHLAIINNNMAIVDELLNHGADLRIKNRRGLDSISLYQKIHFES